jgi:predicted dinucleotide-binding enzyme
MKQKVAIIGQGHVGSALQRGLSRAGYDVRTATREDAQQIASWGEVIILAVPWRFGDEAIVELGTAIDDKPLIDVTNALTSDIHLALDRHTSAAEELQRKAPRARVVKAFNTVFADEMDSGHTRGEQLSTFVAGDDAPAKKIAMQLARDIGFDAVDAGPLENARSIEALAQLNTQLGYALGTDIGFRLVHG